MRLGPSLKGQRVRAAARDVAVRRLAIAVAGCSLVTACAGSIKEGMTQLEGQPLSAIIAAGEALPAALADLSYSRDMEREADDYAIERMHDAGLPLAPLADLLEKMEAAHAERTKSGGKGGARLEGYLSTHPDTAERVRKLRSAAATGH